MSNTTYSSFDKFVLRTPLLPLDFFLKLTSSDEISDEAFIEAFQHPMIKESIYLATPSLYDQLTKFTKDELDDSKKITKMKGAFLKYLARMSTRCTPFGLFAGCSVGNFGEKNVFSFDEKAPFESHTRLDMNFAIVLSGYLVKHETIKQKLAFFPNTTLYPAGEELRYVEFTYKQGRNYQVVEVEQNEYLDLILQKAKHGALLGDLVQTVVAADEDISPEEASEYMDQLIDSQILVSELEPAVTGPEFIDQVLEILKKIEAPQEEIQKIEEIQQQIAALDENTGQNIGAYSAIISKIDQYPVEYDRKHLFQTDLVLGTKENELSKIVSQDLLKGLVALSKLSPKMQNEDNIDKFKEAFYKRYENREMPLAEVLDVEIGLGYPVNQNRGDANPLLGGVSFNNQEQKAGGTKQINWSPTSSLLLKKLFEANANQKQTIHFSAKELADVTDNLANMPATVSTISQLVTENKETKLVLGPVGSPSATNLLGRFCHTDPHVNDFVNEIVEVENQLNAEGVLAEIVHLPEDRIGNILMRPAFRDYEIPYLSKSTKDADHQFPINDIVISVRNEQIKLRSKRTGLEIKPKLSNAHNFTNGLPIYRFLASLQTLGKDDFVMFQWGIFQDELDFLPRVEFENIILSLATWKIDVKEYTNILKGEKPAATIIAELRKWREKYRIPSLVTYAEGDNKLPINFDNATSAQMLATLIKGREKISFTEFLSTQHEAEEGNDFYQFCNEYIFCLHQSRN